MAVNWRSVLSGVFALLASAFFLAWNQGWLPTSQKAVPQTASCADLKQGCDFTLNGQIYHIQSDQAVTPAHPFVLTLTGAPVTSGTASWQMVGMDMGPNRFHFAPGPHGQWQTHTALPFCTQARNDWLLTLNINKTKAVLTIQLR